MKVTVKFDESAALKPSEVKVNQLRDNQWVECERLVRAVQPVIRVADPKCPCAGMGLVNIGELIGGAL